jgi:hypothetical protein
VGSFTSTPTRTNSTPLNQIRKNPPAKTLENKILIEKEKKKKKKINYQ